MKDISQRQCNADMINSHMRVQCDNIEGPKGAIVSTTIAKRLISTRMHVQHQ